jgi:predicted RNA-binding Zn-ribbon protein involved in translation (DUF1610 family)
VANSPKHSTAEYRRARSIVVPAAYADPSYRCPYCGLTMAERKQTHPNETYDCGHAEPPWTYGYAAWHASCNRSLGAEQSNRSRHGNALGL